MFSQKIEFNNVSVLFIDQKYDKDFIAEKVSSSQKILSILSFVFVPSAQSIVSRVKITINILAYVISAKFANGVSL
jgi:hypothetical protein